MLKALIFDVDGTLVDSNDAHAHSWALVLNENGYPVSFEQVRELIGKGGDKLLPELAGIDKESPEGQRISDQRMKLFKTRYMPKLKAFPAAHHLVARLRQMDKKLAVATSAQAEEIGQLLKIAGVDNLIEDRTTSSDAERSKPDPDIVHAALLRAGTPAATAVMIGDTPYDIEAARRAGVAHHGERHVSTIQSKGGSSRPS